MINKSKHQQRERRRKRIRAKVAGTAERPRLAIFKSNKAIYAQLINDDAGTTLASATSLAMKGKNKTEQAKMVGVAVAKAAAEKGLKLAVFDRGGFIYTGRVRALAEGAREGGLVF
ncbi:MAG: 50S ribosomal protein L18 [Candidatus Pacebacteria bacterium]|nr:50S ribosomal protein L18 [Candidatus Paceibacterota bacterium]